jgi:hypothetical protein
MEHPPDDTPASHEPEIAHPAAPTPFGRIGSWRQSAFFVFPEFSAVFRDFGSRVAYEFRYRPATVGGRCAAPVEWRLLGGA